MNDPLFLILQRRDEDYSDYGGLIERWKDDSPYPDCSCGCKWFLPLEGDYGSDWGVCGNPFGHRAGLLTFEHQAGETCYEE